ncbi:MAG TPA: sterol desaturase family protein [Burkholderiaceae bacterium]|nr:sterol desaturase family protein [Burkholderiaceae bacterium]
MQVYSNGQTMATLGLGIGHLFVGLTVIEVVLNYIDSAIPNKPLTLPPGLVWGICAFVAIDFLKYIAHRLAHEIGFLWAEHAVHHAAVEFNFTTHMRHGWLGFLSSGMLASALFCLVGGLHTVLIVYFFINTLVQTLAHTQLIHKMGFLETFMVTPSHHRVHHAVDRAVHDHNYGNVFIVWDKLLGTFKPEGAIQTAEFGLAYAPKVEAPLWQHAFFAWIDWLKNFKRKEVNASHL